MYFGHCTPGLCKNKDCVNPRTGQRRQLQSGCNGYCRSCARTFAATAATDARAREYAGKEKCTRCRVALAQITDPVTGGRYCKICAKQPDSCAAADACAYCRSRNAAVSAAACTVSSGAPDLKTSCFTPDVNSMAGDWDLAVLLDGVVFSSSTMRVRCGAGRFQDDGYCFPCPEGTACDHEGVTKRRRVASTWLGVALSRWQSM